MTEAKHMTTERLTDDLATAERCLAGSGIIALVNLEYACKVLADEFARIRGAETEECAKVVEASQWKISGATDMAQLDVSSIATAIRARIGKEG